MSEQARPNLHKQSVEQKAPQIRPAVLPEELPAQFGSLTGVEDLALPSGCNHRQRQAAVLQLQRTQGNRQVRRLLQRIPAGGSSLAGPTAAPTAAPAAPAGSPLASTAASSLSRLPPAVVQEHGRLHGRNDLMGALMAVVRHMEGQGEIDNSLMAPPTAGGAQAVCANLNRYIINPALGSSAVATPCGCVQSGPDRLPNIRIEVGVGAIRDPVTLQSTLFHEFRHVRQEHEQCTLNLSGSGHGGVVTDCNNPDEMDAYLSEAEAGYNPPSVRHAWVRVYVNWPWLAPEQQQVFMPRQRTVRQKVDGMFPGVDWANDAEVGTYQTFCQQLDQRAGGNTQGTADSPLAPLSAPGPRSGGPVPEPPPPRGDFPMPPEGERIA